MIALSRASGLLPDGTLFDLPNGDDHPTRGFVEQLDGLLLGGSPAGPDADAMQRVARALRGTATMAKLPSFAEVAAGVERVGRAMQEGVLRWDPALGGAMVATIDDLKTLLHSARTWSAADDQRAS